MKYSKTYWYDNQQQFIQEVKDDLANAEWSNGYDYSETVITLNIQYSPALNNGDH